MPKRLQWNLDQEYYVLQAVYSTREARTEPKAKFHGQPETGSTRYHIVWCWTTQEGTRVLNISVNVSRS